MNPDHDIMRDPPDEEECQVCGGVGEVDLLNRNVVGCPACLQSDHDYETDRLRAGLTVTCQAATDAINALMALSCCIQNDHGTWRVRKHHDMQGIVDAVNRTVPIARRAIAPSAPPAAGEGSAFPEWSGEA